LHPKIQNLKDIVNVNIYFMARCKR
jgi:hypothetical protein